jgi:hypothetical protein
VTDLNATERALLKAEADRVKSMRRWDEKLDALRKKVTLQCQHKRTEDFTWEHDDGYGRQTKCPGKRCLLCLKENRWPTLSNAPVNWR